MSCLNITDPVHQLLCGVPPAVWPPGGAAHEHRRRGGGGRRPRCRRAARVLLSPPLHAPSGAVRCAQCLRASYWLDQPTPVHLIYIAASLPIYECSALLQQRSRGKRLRCLQACDWRRMWRPRRRQRQMSGSAAMGCGMRSPSGRRPRRRFLSAQLAVLARSLWR